VAGANVVGIIAASHAPGDQNTPVFADRLSNRLKTLLLGCVNETTGIDDDHAGIFVMRCNLVTLNLELRQDTF
jgi:hypothetical protein